MTQFPIHTCGAITKKILYSTDRDRGRDYYFVLTVEIKRQVFSAGFCLNFSAKDFSFLLLFAVCPSCDMLALCTAQRCTYVKLHVCCFLLYFYRSQREPFIFSFFIYLNSPHLYKPWFWYSAYKLPQIAWQSYWNVQVIFCFSFIRMYSFLTMNLNILLRTLRKSTICVHFH